MTPIKYRTSRWFDTKTRELLWGVQVKTKEDNEWYNVSENGKPMFFVDKKNASKRVKLLNDDLKK